MYKIYIQNNYFFIEDSNSIYEGLKKDVRVNVKNFTDTDPIISFSNVKDWNDSKSIKLSQIVDENENPFADIDAFKAFYTDATGFNGGGTAPTESVLEEISATQDVTFFLTAENSYINNLGNVVASANWRTSEFINVNESVEYRYFGRTNIGGAAYAVAGYNSSNVFVSFLLSNNVNGASGVDFTIPVGIAKIRICSYFDTTLDLIKLEPKIAVKQEYIDVDYINSIVIHPEVNVGKEPISKTWASVGTSITSNNDSPSLKGYQENVLTVFQLNGFTNYGYSGKSLAGTSISDTSCIMNNSTNWVSHDIFTMESITNDFKRNIPIGTLTDYTNNTGITTYYGALRVFKDKIQSLNNNAIIVVANALKRNNGGYTSTSANTQGHTLLDYEIALLTVAQLNNWRFIDQFRESGITDENLFATTTDGLHPNNFGYSILSKIWVREFFFLKYL